MQKLAATALSFEAISRMIQELADTAFYIQRNAHARIQLHALGIRLISAIQNKKLSSLVN